MLTKSVGMSLVFIINYLYVFYKYKEMKIIYPVEIGFANLSVIDICGWLVP